MSTKKPAKKAKGTAALKVPATTAKPMPAVDSMHASYRNRAVRTGQAKK